MRRRGFTLIELLVVIAIIAILAAILFPVFAAAKEQSRRAVCLSNMRQIGAAVSSYKNDYNGIYPMIRGFRLDGTYQDLTIWQVLSKYAAMSNTTWGQGRNIFKCPSSALPPGGDPEFYKFYTYSGMGTNMAGATPDYNAGWGVNNQIPLRARKDSEFVNSARTLYAADGYGDYFYVASARTSSPYWYEDSRNAQGLAPRHSGGCNIVYCDGHARWMKYPMPTDISRVK